MLKTALHQISLAYSKISLKEICLKLQLDNEQDAEYVVTKAVRDGVLGAGVVVDHEKGWMVCGKTEGVLESKEPRAVFGKRIQFCLEWAFFFFFFSFFLFLFWLGREQER